MMEFLTPELRLNPFPMYAMLREQQPVLQIEQVGLWLVFTYDDVKTALSDHQNFGSGAKMQHVEGVDGYGFSIITQDPPRHTQLRSLVTRAFTPAAVNRLEPRIAAITNELIDQVAGSGKMDLVKELSYPLPVIVIAEMMGIPAEDRAQFKHWSDLIVASADQALGGGNLSGETLRAYQEMTGYFRTVIAERRAAPQDDLISSLIAAEVEGEKLSENEVIEFCRLLLVAGNETTTNLITNAVRTLLEHPDVLDRVRSDRSLVPAAIEETLRYRSPVQAMFRTTRSEVTLSGVTIPSGQVVLPFIGSANRDGGKFADPDLFKIDRDPNPHIAFGHGIHFCLGAPLARLEARVALNAILDRLPDLSLAPGGELEPAAGFIVHGLASLPVTFAPAIR